jgi:hypothetical protein
MIGGRLRSWRNDDEQRCSGTRRHVLRPGLRDAAAGLKTTVGRDDEGIERVARQARGARGSCCAARQGERTPRGGREKERLTGSR